MYALCVGGNWPYRYSVLYPVYCVLPTKWFSVLQCYSYGYVYTWYRYGAGISLVEVLFATLCGGLLACCLSDWMQVFSLAISGRILVHVRIGASYCALFTVCCTLHVLVCCIVRVSVCAHLGTGMLQVCTCTTGCMKVCPATILPFVCVLQVLCALYWCLLTCTYGYTILHTVYCILHSS